MKFIKMEQKQKGRFITRYDITYETEDKKEKRYEMISRDGDIQTFEQLHDRQADAVVLIMHNEENDKILLNREFRLAVGEWVYNFPAGLIDSGETVYEAAKRELWEETGLTLDSVGDILSESYSAVGFSNEKNVCLVGTASGTFQKSTSTVEEIVPGWYSKEEVRELMKTQPFAARTQAYCYLWSKM